MRRFIKRGILFVKDLKEEISFVGASVEGLEIRKIDSLKKFEDLEISSQLIGRIRNKSKFSPHVECFAGIVNRKVVHTSFIDYNHPIGVIIFGDFTEPEFRGKHINPAVKSEIFRYLKNKEIKKVYISCGRDNLSSKASILKSGFKQLNLWQRMIIKAKVWLKKVKFIIFI